MAQTLSGALAGGQVAAFAGAGQADRRMLITELRSDPRSLSGGLSGAVTPPAQFVFDANSRTIPRDGWEFSKTVRSRRTDYPGGLVPTEQVLGVKHDEFTLRGEWDDHYAGAGYADQTRRAFEALADRQPMVRVEHDGISITCLLKQVRFRVIRATAPGLVQYELSFSPHYRVPGGGRDDARPATLRGPSEFNASLDQSVSDARDLQAQVNQDAIRGDLYATVSALLDDAAAKVATAAQVTENRVQTAAAKAERPVSALARMAQSYAAVTASAQSVVDALRRVRADVDVSAASVVDVLGFEAWRRGTAGGAREIMATSAAGEAEMRRRDTGDLLTLYRPQRGESLYDVSNRFYGVPGRWRDIAVRNNLSTLELTGLETLEIPNAGAT